MPSKANLNQELLALLDNEQAASCSVPPWHEQVSMDDLQSSRGDRSLPPKFKFRAVVATSSWKEHVPRPKNVYYPELWIPHVFSCIKWSNNLRNLSLVMFGVFTFFFAKVSLSPKLNYGHKVANFFMPQCISSHYSDEISPTAQFSFMDFAWRGKEEVQFETLIPPSEIDFSSHHRLQLVEEGNCDDILLYLPCSSDERNHALELYNYLLTALVATYMGKAMVILEAPEAEMSRHFACGQHASGKALSPVLSSLLQHPQWLSRGCTM